MSYREGYIAGLKAAGGIAQMVMCRLKGEMEECNTTGADNYRFDVGAETASEICDLISRHIERHSK